LKAPLLAVQGSHFN